MERTRVEDEIIGLERQFWQALQDNDVEAAKRLSDFPVVMSGPQGSGTIDESTFDSMMRQASYKLEGFEIKESPSVRLLGDDVAVLGYQVHETFSIDGERVELDAAQSSTWVKRDGRWGCAAHAESIKGDPFGRDRRAEGGAA